MYDLPEVLSAVRSANRGVTPMESGGSERASERHLLACEDDTPPLTYLGLLTALRFGRVFEDVVGSETVTS